MSNALLPPDPILVVDDEEQALTSMSITLRSAGFNNIRTCSDAAGVPDLLTRESFSLVLLDLNMPRMSGQQIMRKAQALQKHPPFVIVTASSQLRDYAEGATYGVIDYLVKPVDRERVIEVVRRALVRPSGTSGTRLTRDFLLSDRIGSGASPRESPASAGVTELLEQTRREYRRLIHGLPIPYVLLEQDDFRVRYCNEAFVQFLGMDSRAATERLPLFELFDAESREKAVRALEAKGEFRDEDLQGRTPSGRTFAIVGSFRLSASDGYIDGGFVDVTASHKLQQELARASRLDAMGRLASGLAHDFNNTLLVVSGFAEMILLENGVPESALRDAGEIRAAAEKAKRMIQQLLSIGRAPSRHHACIDMNEALTEARSSLRQHLPPSHSLLFSLDARSPLVDVSVDQVDQVVRNLVLNARDAMPAGGTITVSTRNGEESSGGRGSVVLEVRDTGMGMTEEVQARIFEPFFTTKPASMGTGLGLPMVQLIIEAAGGTIHVSSAPGKGTTFSIVLPSAAADTRGN